MKLENIRSLNNVCQQVDDHRDDLIGVCQDVYISEIPTNIIYKKVYPIERDQQINNCTDINTRKQRYCVWTLLRKIVEQKYKVKFNTIKFTRTEEGKWICPNFHFSLTHSNNHVALAISRNSIGIDLESVQSLDRRGIEKKILTPVELDEFNSLGKDEQLVYLTEKWTTLEARYKCDNSFIIKLNNNNMFDAKRCDIFDKFDVMHNTLNSTSCEIILDDKKYIISVASSSVKDIIVNKIKL